MQTRLIVDVVNDCVHILSFLDEAIGCYPQRNEITLSHDASQGLSLILSNVGSSLRASGVAMENKQIEMEV